MKKLLLLLSCAALIVFGLAACSEPGTKADKTAKIELEGNATTGYQWKLKENGENVSVSEGEYKTNSAKEGMTGVGGVSTFTVTGVKEGSCSIVLEYTRFNDSVSETKVFTATVASDLSVTVSEVVE